MTALLALAGEAKFDGAERRVHVRVAAGERELREHGEHDLKVSNAPAYWIDLCNDKWQAVIVTPEGWQVVDRPPVMFARTATMKALP